MEPEILLLNLGKRLSLGNFHFYSKAERRSLLATKWPLLIYLAYLTFVIIGATIYTIIFEMIPGRSEPATWYLLLKMWYAKN